jgi:aurora kinase
MSFSEDNSTTNTHSEYDNSYSTNDETSSGFESKSSLEESSLEDSENLNFSSDEEHINDDFWNFDVPFKGSKLKDYTIQENIAKGKFGDITLVTKGGKKYVMKRLDKYILLSKKGMAKQAKNEVEIQYRLSKKSKYIVKLLDYFKDEDSIYMILEYCPGGNLFDKRQKRFETRFTESEASYYIYQIAMALKHCHDNGVIHRDIKLENILITSEGYLKLADFGWSAQLKSSNDRRTTICGTLDYFSPEMINSVPYKFSTDIWSLGVVAYELIVGDVPFLSKTKQGTYKMISDYAYKLPNFISNKGVSFIENCLTNHLDRMNINKVLSHKWIK